MSLYKCKVMNQYGKGRLIKLNGISLEDIVHQLKTNNYIIIDVRRAKEAVRIGSTFRKHNKIKPRDLSLFCKQLYAMLRSGITIVKCIEILSLQTENKWFKNIIGEIHKDLLTGKTFSESLCVHGREFPELFISMAEAGEISGSIDVVMRRLSSNYEKEYKIENKVKSAMIYPIILSVVSTAVVIFLLVKVMPTFINLYSSSGIPLPMATLILLNISNLLKNMWYVFILLIALFVAGISRAIKIDKVKYKIDFFKLKIPIYKNMIMKLATSRFTRTLATLMKSGVPLLDALETVSKVTGNAYIGNAVLKVKEDVSRGSSLSQPLSSQNIFPPMVSSMIRIGEDTGTIEELLDETANFYDEEVENAVQRFVAMIEPIMIVLMAAIIGFIVLAMVTPMFDMIRTVQ